MTFGDLWLFFNQLMWNFICRYIICIQIWQNDKFEPMINLTFNDLWWPLMTFGDFSDFFNQSMWNLIFRFILSKHTWPNVKIDLWWSLVTIQTFGDHFNIWWPLVVFQLIDVKFGMRTSYEGKFDRIRNLNFAYHTLTTIRNPRNDNSMLNIMSGSKGEFSILKKINYWLPFFRFCSIWKVLKNLTIINYLSSLVKELCKIYFGDKEFFLKIFFKFFFFWRLITLFLIQHSLYQISH